MPEFSAIELWIDLSLVPAGSPSHGWDVVVSVKDIYKPTELAHAFFFLNPVLVSVSVLMAPALL